MGKDGASTLPRGEHGAVRLGLCKEQSPGVSKGGGQAGVGLREGEEGLRGEQPPGREESQC